MTNRDGPIARAIRVAHDDEARVLGELGRARRGAGLSREAVGRACGLPGSSVERLEAGTRRSTIRELAAYGAIVGLDVRLRAYPAGDPLRDAGQQRLLERFRPRLHRELIWRAEVTLPIKGDRRAWDALIRGMGWVMAVEAETVLDDLQAVERRIALKQRDGGIDHVILLVADTRRNRNALAAAPNAFPGFGRDARAILRDIAAGRDPGSSAIVVL